MLQNTINSNKSKRIDFGLTFLRMVVPYVLFIRRIEKPVLSLEKGPLFFLLSPLYVTFL